MRKSKIDSLIEQEFYKRGKGVIINLLDIPRLFELVRSEIGQGRQVGEAMDQAIEKFKMTKEVT